MMTDTWTPATRIGLRPKGEAYCVDVFLMYNKPESLDKAIANAVSGRTVFVRREDAGAVLAALAALAQEKESGQ